jgi:histidinol-phosphatase (PHP family)
LQSPRDEGTIVENRKSELPRGLASVHTHSHYCDGHDNIEDYLRASIDAGLVAYGASGHSPLPIANEWSMTLENFELYVREVRHLASAFASQIPVLLGLELDFLPGVEEFYRQYLFARGLDYIVASVHYVGDPTSNLWAYDESAEAFDRQIVQNYTGDARPVVEDYYRRVTQMAADIVTWGVPVVVGHLDRIVLWNRGDRYFPTNNAWYTALVDEALTAIARSGCVLEINTSGWEKAIGDSNPNLPILRRAAAAGIPVIISADAHRAANVALHYQRALAVLEQAGFKHLMVPGVGAWERVSLPSL